MLIVLQIQDSNHVIDQRYIIFRKIILYIYNFQKIEVNQIALKKCKNKYYNDILEEQLGTNLDKKTMQ